MMMIIALFNVSSTIVRPLINIHEHGAILKIAL